MTDESERELTRLSDAELTEPERITAARRLAELEDPATVLPMLHLVQGELSDALAGEIRKALDLIGAGKVLMEDLSRADDFGRAEAATQLGRMGERAAIEPLMRALSDAAPKVRESAAGSLGILQATEAEAALIERLSQDASPDVRGAAAQSLGLLQTPGAKAALRQAMTAEQDGFVKVLIEKALQ
jgi:HEAT repeat protein